LEEKKMKKIKRKNRCEKLMNISGNWIRAARMYTSFSREKRMSQTELAERMTNKGCPMTRITIGRIESRKRAVTDYELVCFSDILNVDLNLLVKGIGPFATSYAFKKYFEEYIAQKEAKEKEENNDPRTA
jgi:transcriptional regulator with XRE-family HTH domain